MPYFDTTFNFNGTPGAYVKVYWHQRSQRWLIAGSIHGSRRLTDASVRFASKSVGPAVKPAAHPTDVEKWEYFESGIGGWQKGEDASKLSVKYKNIISI